MAGRVTLLVGLLAGLAVGCGRSHVERGKRDDATAYGDRTGTVGGPRPLPGYGPPPGNLGQSWGIPPSSTVGQQPPPSGSIGAEQGASCIRAEATLCQIEAAILELTNQVRREKLGPQASLLTLSPTSSFVARDWSAQQTKLGLSHKGFPRERMALFQVSFPGITTPYVPSAENVGMTMAFQVGSPAALAADFVNMWRTSPGHLRNILGPHQYLGVGVSHSGMTWYATQIFN